jgi:hypothetical protein
MATLINAKQLDTSVSSSIVNGNLVITGSLTVTGSSIFASDISASRVIGVNVADVRGAFKTYSTLNELNEENINLISDNQIVWVESENSLYKSTITQPDFSSSFEPTASWTEFTFPNEISDITSAIAGSGLVPSGNTISIGQGNGILVSEDDISLNTGSLHFQSGVEKIISLGSFTIDAGRI